MTPRMPEQRFDAVVIGAGPAATAAIRLGQLKIKTAIIERSTGACASTSGAFRQACHPQDVRQARHSTTSASRSPASPRSTWPSSSLEGGVVGKLTGGVRTLLKATSRDHRRLATLGKPGPTATDHGQERIGRADHPRQERRDRHRVAADRDPGFKIDQSRIIDSTGALALTAVPPRLIVIGAATSASSSACATRSSAARSPSSRRCRGS